MFFHDPDVSLCVPVSRSVYVPSVSIVFCRTVVPVYNLKSVCDCHVVFCLSITGISSSYVPMYVPIRPVSTSMCNCTIYVPYVPYVLMFQCYFTSMCDVDCKCTCVLPATSDVYVQYVCAAADACNTYINKDFEVRLVLHVSKDCAYCIISVNYY